jgi:hypothetical protein
MDDVTIAEMVRNGTMSAEMAAVIWAAVDDQVSFLTAAIPRFAGKTTTSEAALALRPAGVPLHRIDGSRAQTERLAQERLGGYLVVAEFEQAPMPGYIWGEPVRRVFNTLDAGYSLQAVLHAGSVAEAISEVTHGNGVPDVQVAAFKLVLYIERFGAYGSFTRRLSDLFELKGVENGRPVGQSLFRWQAEGDRFEQLAEPSQWGNGTDDLKRRAEVFAALAKENRTSSADVRSAIDAFRP